MTSVPDSLLLVFFDSGAEAMENFPPSASEGESSRKSLLEHRTALLQVQINTLNEVVEHYNITNDPITMEDAQAALGTFTTHDAELQQAHEHMNECARLAFVRSVIMHEQKMMTETSDPGEYEDKSVDKGVVLEFIGLCAAALRLPQVMEYLKGKPLNFETTNDDTEPEEVKPEERLEELQKMILSAMGHDPTSSYQSLHDILQTPQGTTSSIVDDDLLETLTTFASAVRVALANATPFELLTDETDGGHTRVVSVQYSEKTINPDGSVSNSNAPSSMGMDQHDPSRAQLEMAKHAATMHQEILGELLGMDEDDRIDALAHAKEVHDSFMDEALGIPAGPERVLFLQSVGSERQRELIMHKLWEGMLAKNGGEAPVRRE